MKIITNNHARELLTWAQLPAGVQEDYDWEGAEFSTYFHYRDWYYCLDNFTRVTSIDDSHPLYILTSN